MITDQKNQQSLLFNVRKTPKQQRSKKLVSTILQGAARILEQQDQPFTTNHIAECAGVSIGSLYQYFPTAQAILATLIKQHVADERLAAQKILANWPAEHSGCSQSAISDIFCTLLLAFIRAHSCAPRLTAQIHALAPSFGLQEYLHSARDEQARQIATVLHLPPDVVIMSVIAVEGVVLATLACDHKQLSAPIFLERLHAIALAPLGGASGLEMNS